MTSNSKCIVSAPHRFAVVILLSIWSVGWDDAAPPAPSDEARAIIPWQHFDEATRTKLASVIDDATIYHRTPSEVFVCSPELYLLFLRDPVLTLELWRTLGNSNATLAATAPNQFEGKDGHAGTGRWEFVYSSPELHIVYAEGEYRGPLLKSTLETRSVLILRTLYFQERDGKQYVKHRLEGFVKADSGSLKPLAKALRPLFQKSVQGTMQESQWFVSLMCRYAIYDPHRISQALAQGERIDAASRGRLEKLLAPLLASTPPRDESDDAVVAAEHSK